MSSLRRVVVTGLGSLTSNGNSTQQYWDAIVAGKQGIGPITRFDTSKLKTRFGGEVKLTDVELAGGDAKIVRRKDRVVLLALRAAQEAIAQSGLDYKNWADPFRIGTIIGSGIGGMATMQGEHKTLFERGPERVSPMLIPKMIVDSAAGDVSIAFGARGPNYAIVTACATGTHCIGSAFQQIRWGICDAVIAGGTEAPLTEIGFAGFNSIGALSTRNESPETACRPFDKDRDGFIMAEGAGILILEEYEHAKKRGANILGEIVGFGCSGDAYHETAPDPEGRGGVGCLKAAIADAKIAPEQVGYFNAHGTSTPLNDKGETALLKRVFGDHAKKMVVSSTKSMIGHTLGAAGGVESIATILSLKHGIITPTINYTTPDPECDLDYVPNVARKAQVEYAMNNNLGFGGHNACVIFKRFTG